MTKFTSDKLKAVSFISMLMVVYLHAYNLNVEIRVNSLVVSKNYNTFIQNFISQGVTRTAVPMFFLISGYLFFLNIKTGHYNIFLAKIKSRLKTLGIPYIMWSVLGIVVYYVFQSVEFSKPYFTNDIIREYSRSNWFQTVLIQPIPYQLWFIRDLLALIFLSPLIYWVLNKIKYFFLLFLLILWFFNFDIILFSNEAILFFAIGGFIALNKFENQFNIFKRNSIFLTVTWLLLVFVKTSLIHINYENQFLIILIYKMSIIIGLSAIWFIYDKILSDLDISSKWYYRLFKYSFFLYAFHEPFLKILKKAMHILMGNTELSSFLIFLSAPLLVIMISIIFAWYLKLKLPSLYSLLSGGR